jgi:hypothetical protein
MITTTSRPPNSHSTLNRCPQPWLRAYSRDWSDTFADVSARPWHLWRALVFAGAALGAACSNSGQRNVEETHSYPPLNYCPFCKSPDGAVSILPEAPDGCILDLDAGSICVLPPQPAEASGP